MKELLLVFNKEDRKTINLYKDTAIKSQRTVFNIVDEEDMYEWWEYHLEHMDLYDNDNILTFLQMAYRLLMNVSTIKKAHKRIKKWNFDIVFEHSSAMGYWTFRNRRVVRYLRLNQEKISAFDYKIEKQKITFRMPLDQASLHLTKPTKFQPEVYIAQSRYKKTEPSLHTEDFLDTDDRQTLAEVIEGLQERSVYLEQKGFTAAEVEKIEHEIGVIAMTIGPYRELAVIHQCIQDFSLYLHRYKEILVNLDHTYVSLFEGLFNNIKNWFTALFVSGTESITALDASIRADIDIIKAMTASGPTNNRYKIDLF